MRIWPTYSVWEREDGGGRYGSDVSRTITTAERRRRIGVRHHLANSHRTDDVHAITESLVALHASDPATVHLSAAVRMRSPNIGAVEAALYDERTIVRQHAMRRTIWVMTMPNVRRAHAATTAKIAAGERRKTVEAIAASTDFDDPERWFEDARAEVIALLAAEGSLSTRKVGQLLPHLAVPLEFGSAKNTATLNAHSKVLQGAGFDGDVVRGRPKSWISSEYPWSVMHAWLGESITGMDKRQAAAELVERWLRTFGPGTETDLVWWLGDTKTLVRTALADCGAVEVRLEDGSSAWVAADDDGETGELEPWVRLLPGLDPTSMGWKERDHYIEPAYVEPMFDRFGNIGPAIWADGQIVGGWAQRDDSSIVYELFMPLSKTHQRMLDEAIDQVHAVVDGVQVKPRFPAKMQKSLLA